MDDSWRPKIDKNKDDDLDWNVSDYFNLSLTFKNAFISPDTRDFYAFAG